MKKSLVIFTLGTLFGAGLSFIAWNEPANPKTLIIKRVVGLHGDSIFLSVGPTLAIASVHRLAAAS